MLVPIFIFHCINDCQLHRMICSVKTNSGGASIIMLIYFAYICIYNNITSEASVDLQKNGNISETLTSWVLYHQQYFVNDCKSQMAVC